MGGLDFDGVQNSVTRVVEVLRVLGREGRIYWLANFPADSCDITSFVIGHVLADRSDGDWWIVSGANGIRNHTWLECRDNEKVVITVDVTLHQFQDIAVEPYVGPGVGPAKGHFTAVHLDSRIATLPENWRPDFWEALTFVRRHIARD